MNILHIYPIKNKFLHICDVWCACEPYLNYKDIITGNEVWVHIEITWN